jgi:hypothetical protein
MSQQPIYMRQRRAAGLTLVRTSPQRAEGSVWRRGYACGYTDGIWLSYASAFGYALGGAVIGGGACAIWRWWP